MLSHLKSRQNQLHVQWFKAITSTKEPTDGRNGVPKQ